MTIAKLYVLQAIEQMFPLEPDETEEDHAEQIELRYNLYMLGAMRPWARARIMEKAVELQLKAEMLQQN